MVRYLSWMTTPREGPSQDWPVRLSGTENRHKAIQKSHAEVGFLSGLRPPFITVSGNVKSYRPRKLRWRQISGERWVRHPVRGRSGGKIGIALPRHRQVERPPAWPSRGSRISALDDDAPRPALCWLSLSRRAHQLCGLAVFPVPVEPAHG